MPLERPEAQSMILKELGIWLNLNKQTNVRDIITAEQPVAVKAGLTELLFKFAFDFGLGAIGLGQGVGSTIQGTVKGWFTGFGDWIANTISPLAGTVDVIDTGFACQQVISSGPLVTTLGDINNLDVSATASMVTRGLTGDYSPVSAKIQEFKDWGLDLYKTNIIPGPDNTSLEAIYNAFNTPVQKVFTALGMPEITLGSAVTFVSNQTGIGDVQTKIQELADLAADPLNSNSLIQSKIAELTGPVNTLFNQMTADRAAYAEIAARDTIMQESGRIYQVLQTAQADIVAAENEGDTARANDVKAFVTAYKAGLNPDLVSYMEQLITIQTEIDNGLTPVETTASATPAPNPFQYLGDLPA